MTLLIASSSRLSIAIQDFLSPFLVVNSILFIKLRQRYLTLKRLEVTTVLVSYCSIHISFEINTCLYPDLFYLSFSAHELGLDELHSFNCLFLCLTFL